MVKIPFYTAYGKKPKCDTYNNDPSLVDDQYKYDNDVNHFIKRYLQDGVLPQFNGKPIYGDFTHIIDYKDALNKVIEAKNKFMELPSSIREKFDNSPNEFLNFVNNPENHDEMVKMGLKKTSSVPSEPEISSPKPQKVEEEKSQAHEST